MRKIGKFKSKLGMGGTSAVAIAFAMLHAGSAMAQTTAAQANETPAEQAGAGESGNERDIVVSGSRIERKGFDQPTPTTVIGDTEIRQAAPSNLQQVLLDQPQVRPTLTPASGTGTPGAGATPFDLRGLGDSRTLVLVNRRRSVSSPPVSLVNRMEIVTGGASAAWGSDAVAGVVNIILDDDLEGLSLGAETGISSRNDGWRYSFDGSFGTRFAGGQGHFMIGAEYSNDKGIGPQGRRERPNLGGATVNTSATTSERVQDVNSAIVYYGGLIRNGIFAGQVFNPDGTLRPFRGPTLTFNTTTSGIGGADASAQFDDFWVTTPAERINSYARATYDIGGATLWADASYSWLQSDFPIFPDPTRPQISIRANNAFLSQDIRSALAAANQTSFMFGRVYRDIATIQIDNTFRKLEGAFGIDGTLGEGWQYRAHYSHGETEFDSRFNGAFVTQNFTRAVDAVLSNGQIVCAVNADANPANDDPACRPLNVFGEGNASPEAIDYVTDDQRGGNNQTLDSISAEIQGDLGSLWAGPISVAFGAEARWLKQTPKLDARTMAGGFAFAAFTNPIEGKQNVKEVFAETILPLLDVGPVKLDFQGAARYSDYSLSGGIWSWKVGGTARLFNDLLLRSTLSRDIRAPAIGELFQVQTLGFLSVVDADSAGRTGIPGYNSRPTNVPTFTGGNPDLDPEIGKTLTLGGSFSPSFIPGFQLSADYYNIKLADAIGRLNGSQLTLACSMGVQVACDNVIRDPDTETVVEVFTFLENLQLYQQRGIDLEAVYLLPMSKLSSGMSGSLRFRGLATRVLDQITDTGIIVTDAVATPDSGNGVPKWRGLFSATYQDPAIGLDLRLRYISPSQLSGGATTLVNNRIEAKLYVDVGAQFKVGKDFVFFGNIRNLFDAKPPIVGQFSFSYDQVGRYFTVGSRLNF